MPLSKDPEKRARQLANLPNTRGEPTDGSIRPGEARALKHGGRTRQPWRSPIFGSTRNELVDAVAESVPIRGPDGDVLPEFRLAVDAAALQLLTVKRISGYLATHGFEDERGRPRPQNEDLQRALGRLRDWLRELAATPAAYARAGYDVARTERERRDLALRWATGLAEQAGVDVIEGGS